MRHGPLYKRNFATKHFCVLTSISIKHSSKTNSFPFMVHEFLCKTGNRVAGKSIQETLVLKRCGETVEFKTVFIL